MNLDQARFNMVEQQIRPWDVLDPKILDLFMAVPRHEFVAESQQKLAYSDIELPIGESQAMWSPKIEGRILQALDIDKEEQVLEVGTGSGFVTALLATSAKQVTSIDIFPSIQNVAKSRLSNFNNIDFQIGDAANDWQDEIDYDVIILTGSVETLPEAYKNKLALGGRLAVIEGTPPAMVAKVYTRVAPAEWEIETLFETVIEPLINRQAKQTFSF